MAPRVPFGSVDDRSLVAAMVAREPGGLDGVYHAYADRLHAYCTALLRDPETAADAVHDTFIVAWERVAQLRDPARLRPWLYAIARNECLRHLRARRRAAPLEEAGEVIDEQVDPGGAVRSDELRTLVRAAIDGLSPRDREVVELALRHDLDGAEVAAALGVSANQAHALTSRARRQLERALGALLVARTGRADCAELAALLEGWDGRLTPLVRKRLARHVERCGICAERERAEVRPAALLSLLPIAVAPAALRDRVMATGLDAELVSHRTALAERAGRFDRAGFPQPLDRRRGVLASLWPAAAAAAALFGAVLLVTTTGDGQQVGSGTDAGALAVPPSVAPTSASPTAPPTAAPTPAPTAAPTPTPTAAPTRTPPRVTSPPTTPSPPPPAVPTPELALTVTNLSGTCGSVWRAELSAEVSGADADSVTATWTVGSVPPRSQGMTRTGGRWVVEVVLPATLPGTWSADADLADGATLESATEPLTCSE